MHNRYVVVALLTLGLTGVGVSVMVSASEQKEARRLYRALSTYAYWYDDIRAAEGRIAQAVLNESTSLEEAERDFRNIEQRLLVLGSDLSKIDVRGSVRDDVLLPIIAGLRDDGADLASVRQLMHREGLRPNLRSKLEQHIHPPDLIHPAVRAMAARFGFHQRRWRGHPLTA
jgi:hypothetical protein